MRTIIGLLLCVKSALSAPVPSKLSETGLYVDAVKKVVAPENRTYSPQYPLWTDGAQKKRWVFIPAEKTILADNPDQWIFPVGTKFWKEFSFQTDKGKRRIETRFIEKANDDEWTFASYLWNTDESEATLAPEDGVKDYFPLSPTLKHSIPSVSDCLRCHRKQGDGVLGFDALQLSNDRDPFALHAEPLSTEALSLRKLIEEKKFNLVPSEFKNGAVRIPSGSKVGRTVLGYLHSNCASCHNSSGSSMHVRMHLLFSLSAQSEAELPAFQSLIDKKCVVFQFPGEPKGIRVVKGSPEKSVLYRMMLGNGSEHMPPIGTVIHDSEAIEKIRDWISGL